MTGLHKPESRAGFRRNGIGQCQGKCDREQVIVVQSRICFDKGRRLLILPGVVGNVQIVIQLTQ